MWQLLRLPSFSKGIIPFAMDLILTCVSSGHLRSTLVDSPILFASENNEAGSRFSSIVERVGLVKLIIDEKQSLQSSSSSLVGAGFDKSVSAMWHKLEAIASSTGRSRFFWCLFFFLDNFSSSFFSQS